jgi:hypothetical protein
VTTVPLPTDVQGANRRLTSTFRGSLTTRQRAKTFRVLALAGAMKSSARLRGAHRVRLTVRDSAGDVVVRSWLRPRAQVTRSVDAGRYRITLKGSSGTRFTLRVVRQVPVEVWRAARGMT